MDYVSVSRILRTGMEAFFQGDRCDEESLTDFASKSMILYRFSVSWRLDGTPEKYIIAYRDKILNSQ